MSSYVAVGIVGLMLIVTELLVLSREPRRAFRVAFATLALFAALVTVLYLIDHPNAFI